MKDDLQWIEGVLGAVSKINTDDVVDDMSGARCPKCNASDFVRVSDLFTESVGRLEEDPGGASTVRDGGMTDAQIVEKFRPPRRRSAVGAAIVVAIPLSAIAFYMYRRVGENVGQIAIVVDLLVTAAVLMTRLRRYSDEYYERRRRWRSLFLCRKCGQLVAS
jgi:hypothetical protein